MSEFVDALRAELLTLTEQLRKDPVYIRAEMIRDLLKEYRGDPAIPLVSEGDRPPQRRFGGRNAIPKKIRLRTATKEFLRTQPDQTAHRTEILKILEEKSIVGHESDPLQSLGIALTNWNEVVPIGNGRWKLVSLDQR